MHHSDTLTEQSVSLTCYLDESATDGGTPTAVVGGLVLNKSGFLFLDKKWKRMVDKFNLHPALHMKDFGSNGRYSAKTEDERRKVLTRAATIIKKANIYTIAATLEHEQYKSIFPSKMRKVMSPYGLCFIICAMGNQAISEANNNHHPVAFILDSGNAYAKHVLEAHGAMYRSQEAGNPLRLGSLTFEDDKRVSALQAADVICWAVRRRATGYSFKGGFEPIESILDQPGHNIAPFSEKSMRQILSMTLEKYPEVAS